MRGSLIARNYAEALFELALRNEAVETYGTAIGWVGELLDTSPRFRLFLETPRIGVEAKKAVVRRTFGEVLPRPVLNFLFVTIERRRQRLLRAIAVEFALLVDRHLGRENVEVTVARPLEEGTAEVIASGLSRMLGRKAIPHVRVRPEILGGIIVRAGDTIYDGSIRRHLEGMRRRMLHAELPAAGGA